MASLKGFFQFLSIICSVFLFIWLSNADYEKDLNQAAAIADIYSESSASGSSSGFYTPADDNKYLFSGSISAPQEGEQDALLSRIEKYLEMEKIYRENEGSHIISITGDCSLGSLNNAGTNSRFYKYIKETGETYPFDNVKLLFEKDSYTFINLEGTLTAQTKQANKYYRIKGEPEWANKMLAASSVEGCTLANNHSYDYLEEGYNETLSALDSAGIGCASEGAPIVTAVGDIEVVFVVGNYVNDGIQIGSRGNNLTKNIVNTIKKYKKPSNIVIAVCHWGEELENKPNNTQRTAAHAFIDAGADLVAGHHPHVLQGVEQYAGRYIYYSLGNFAFAGNSTVNSTNKKSMILRPRIALTNNTAQITGISIVPCYTSSSGTVSNNFQPLPLFGGDAEEIKEYLLTLSSKIPGGVEAMDVPTTVIE